MIFTAQFELNITIKDVNAIYATDYEQMLLDHARAMYAGQCRDGQYVKSIDRLIRRSLPNLIKRDLSAKVRVYVLVEATVIRYDQCDFITGMTIHKIIIAGKFGNYNILECRNDHVLALVKIHPEANVFKVGDIIPIRAGETIYKIGNQHILVNGAPCKPLENDPVYYNIPELTAGDKSYYNDTLVPLINRELTRKGQLDQTQWDMFSKLFHTFKKMEKGGKTVSLLESDALQNGIFGIDYRADVAQLRAAVLNGSDAKSLDAPVVISGESAKVAMTRIVFQYVKWIGVINDLAEQYPTKDAYDRIGYVWTEYAEQKLD